LDFKYKASINKERYLIKNKNAKFKDAKIFIVPIPKIGKNKLV